ncbi:unnamed protein product [Owenia fusiformis]|uniref:Uncharacterized protein n=1 Tax=Owenia fusiformis TaxID=6347 RepID=A0A8J1TXH8_OWEFU|nr:unnamed protein product [Owenia fusiformis]
MHILFIIICAICSLILIIILVGSERETNNKIMKMEFINLRYYRFRYMWTILLAIACLEFMYFLGSHFLCSNLNTQVNKKISLAQKYSDENQETNRQISIKKIIIMAAYRSGSTFFGELFRQNSDIYYTYEPLKFFSKETEYSTDKKNGSRIVRKVLNCDWSTLLVLYYRGYNWAIKYPDRTFDDIFEMCHKREFSATKIIRQDNLERLASIFGNETAILLLIRDPRGILNSRAHLSVRKEHPLNQSDHQYRLEALTLTCRNFVTNMRYIQNLGTTQKKNMPFIKLVKYEDVACNTIQEAKKLYKYLGLQFPENIAQWIKNNTNNTKDSIYRAFKSQFLTQRNSKAMTTKWLKQLKPSSIFEVQNISECAEVIRMAGYKFVV